MLLTRRILQAGLSGIDDNFRFFWEGANKQVISSQS